MIVYVSTTLVSTLEERIPSKALYYACLSFCSYLLQVTVRFDAARTFGALYSSRKGQRIYTPQVYTEMISLLKGLAVIEETRSYAVGERPKSYRLLSPYSRDIQPVNIPAPKLAARLAKETQPLCGDDGEEDAVAGAQHTRPVDLWLKDVYQTRASFADKVLDVIMTHPYESDEEVTSFHYHYHSFANKSPLYGAAESGRVSYVPNLVPTELRREILIDGEPAIDVDVVASQPRLALSLFPANHIETIAFRDLIDTGRLYETAMEWIGEEWAGKKPKYRFFSQVLYGPREKHKHFPLWRAFEARYPTLAAIIAAEKRQDTRVFPVKLQTIEARIMVEGVMTDCATRQIPILGIHDAIGCKLGDAKEVAQLISHHWTKVTGYIPRLRIGGEFHAG